MILLPRVEIFQIGNFRAYQITIKVSKVQTWKKPATPSNAPHVAMVSNSPNPPLQLLFSTFSRKCTRNIQKLQFCNVLLTNFTKERFYCIVFTKKAQKFRKNSGGKIWKLPHCVYHSVEISGFFCHSDFTWN